MPRVLSLLSGNIQVTALLKQPQKMHIQALRPFHLKDRVEDVGKLYCINKSITPIPAIK